MGKGDFTKGILTTIAALIAVRVIIQKVPTIRNLVEPQKEPT